MSLIVTASRVGILDRAIDIIAAMSNEPARQINIGKETVRWYIHNRYRVYKA